MPHMATERKSTMISARLPAALVARVDYVTRNTEGHETNRSKVILAALDDWLPARETEIGNRLGTTPKKPR